MINTYHVGGVIVESAIPLDEADLKAAVGSAAETGAYRVEAGVSDDGWLEFRYYKKGTPFERIRRITGGPTV